MSPDEPSLRQVHADWIAAVNAGDLDRLNALMADDVLFLNPGQAPQGRDGFPAGFQAAHQRFELVCRSRLDEVEIATALAVLRCWDSLHLRPRDGGAAIAMAGHSLWVFRRQADGRWLLARAIHNLQNESP